MPKRKVNCNTAETLDHAASNLNETFEKVDPFKSNSKMRTSPVRNMQQENPFKTSNKMASSPPREAFDRENAFATKNKMASSPPRSPYGKENAFANSKIPSNVRSPFSEDEDPFTSNSKMASSPPRRSFQDEDDDPFVTKGKMASSPPKFDSLFENLNFFKTAKLNQASEMNGKSSKSAAANDLSHIIGHDSQVNTAIVTPTRRDYAMSHETDKDYENMRIKSNMEAKRKSLGAHKKQPNAEAAPRNDAFNLPTFNQGFGVDEDQFVHPGEIFKDASDLDFLLLAGSSQQGGGRDFEKDSLFLKFDPLAGSYTLPTGLRPTSKRDTEVSLSPQQSAVQSPQHQQRHTLPSPISQASNNPRNHNSANSDCTTPKSNLSSFNSVLNMSDRNPAIEALDRLISLSPSPKQKPEPVPEPIKPIIENPKEDKEKMQYVEDLKLLRQLMTKQQDEFQNKLTEEQTKFAQLEQKEQALIKRLADRAKEAQQMSVVMQEYEKNISKLISDREHDKQMISSQISNMQTERDLAVQDLRSVENAFSDVHKKYERCKAVIEQLKTNEESLKNVNSQLEEMVKAEKNRYEALKTHALSQLDKANIDLDTIRRHHQMEQTKLSAMLKKSELKTISLQEQLSQKLKENEELASICDDLINKVG